MLWDLNKFIILQQSQAGKQHDTEWFITTRSKNGILFKRFFIFATEYELLFISRSEWYQMDAAVLNQTRSTQKPFVVYNLRLPLTFVV